MSRAFVLGNGRSRLSIDLDTLKQHGKIYGCNALYRDFLPNYLIAVDQKMLDELCANRVYEQVNIYTNNCQNQECKQYLNILNPSKGWSSGPTALWLASTHGYEEIFIIGFDYKGTNDNRLNNVYADTPNYKKSTEAATYHGNWKQQTENVFKGFKDIKYRRVVEDDYIDFTWQEFSNYENVPMIEFKTQFFV